MRMISNLNMCCVGTLANVSMTWEHTYSYMPDLSLSCWNAKLAPDDYVDVLVPRIRRERRRETGARADLSKYASGAVGVCYIPYRFSLYLFSLSLPIYISLFPISLCVPLYLCCRCSRRVLCSLQILYISFFSLYLSISLCSNVMTLIDLSIYLSLSLSFSLSVAPRSEHIEFRDLRFLLIRKTNC